MQRNPELRSYPQQIVEAKTGRDVAEYLRELFVDRRLTDDEIADLFGVSRHTILAWRRQFGIDRAHRKAATA